MAKTFFLVRVVIAPHLRDKFDHWHSAHHLPLVIEAFKPEKAWRFWSAAEEGVFYAVFRFRDKAACDAALAPPVLNAVIADFNAAWPEGVTRTRDILTLVEEWSG